MHKKLVSDKILSTMNIPRLLVILFWSVLVLRGNSQNIDNLLETFETKVSFQKLYLHTDREFYFVGDTLWFAAYLVDARTHIPAQGVGNLYVDIIDSKSQVIENQIFPLINGFCPGWISLTDTTSEEEYAVRAYTDYLKNFDSDALFEKKIQISRVKTSSELEEIEGGEVEPEEIDVSFLPEGGFILADKPNRIAFKAIDESGKGIDITGKLFDEEGELILSFKTIYKGAGSFFFYPNRGKTYTAKIDGYPALTFPLEKVREKGAKIKLQSVGEELLQLVIQAKDGIRDAPYYLVCINRGEGFLMKIEQERLNTLIKMDLSTLRAGINRFVLTNRLLDPISERLIFINDPEVISYELDLSATSFSTRDKVTLGLHHSQFEEEVSWASVSVVDEIYISSSGISQNMESYLLLDSELKGNIESPADYFQDSEKLSSNIKLDLLMSVNGWRNYLWNHLDTHSLKYPPQFGFNFTGHVKGTFGKKALTDGTVSLIVYKSDSTTSFFDQKLDSKGEFRFENMVIYDSASVFAQARNKRNKHNLQFKLNLPEFDSPRIDFNERFPGSNPPSISSDLYLQKHLNEIKLKEFFPDSDIKWLDEVVVKGRRAEPKINEGIVKKNDGPYSITRQETAGTTDIIQYLAFKVPGIIPINGGQSISIVGNDGEPLIYIDGGTGLSVDQARAYSVDAFATIELITPPLSYLHRAPNGVILLTTKSGKTESAKHVPLLGGMIHRIKGFSRSLQFYSPKYTPENIHFEAPDLRSTLYWNPQIEFVDGKSEISFYTCDNLAQYRILVEGISEKGKICMGEARFSVDKKR